jgi:transposase
MDVSYALTSPPGRRPQSVGYGISKQGDRYLRRLLVVGATAVMRHIKDKPTPMADWIRKLSEKKPFRVVSVALANKLARIAWVVLTRKEAYQPYHLAA